MFEEAVRALIPIVERAHMPWRVGNRRVLTTAVEFVFVRSNGDGDVLKSFDRLIVSV
jgi:hypothetical protein